MTRVQKTCVLCGLEDQLEVRVCLVRWREPIAGRLFDAIPRCTNRVECRQRVAALGDPWLVTDRRDEVEAMARAVASVAPEQEAAPWVA